METRTCERPGEPLPPIPDSCYPPDAVPLDGPDAAAEGES